MSRTERVESPTGFRNREVREYPFSDELFDLFAVDEHRPRVGGIRPVANGLSWVGELIETLPERERTVVEMTMYGRETQEYIAEHLGVSQPYVSRILQRALARLKEMIEQR